MIHDQPALSAAASGNVSSAWKTIAPMRGIAMVLVVANHAAHAASAIALTGRSTFSPYREPATFLLLHVVRALTPVCLLLFMFASGFLSFRFFSDAKSAWHGALHLLRKYLGWSVALYALDAALHRRVSWPQVLAGLVRGDVAPAYWFLVTLFMLYLSAPLWIRLVKTRPALSLALAFALQVASCVHLYVFQDAARTLETWEILFVRPCRFLPAFMLGMLASREAARVCSWLYAHRRPWLWLTLAAALATLGEAYWLGARAHFHVHDIPTMYATERVSLIVFALACIGAVLSTDFGVSRLSHGLAAVGNASLGVMLVMDLCVASTVTFLWQLPRFVWPEAATAYTHHALPQTLIEHAGWLLPLFFVAGLYGPLFIMALVRRTLGARARLLW